MNFHKEFLSHSEFFLNSPNGEQFLNSLRIPEREELSHNIIEPESRYLLNSFFYSKELPNSCKDKIRLIHLLDQLLSIDSQLIEDEYQKNKEFLLEIPEDLLQQFYSNYLVFYESEFITLINFFRYSGNDTEELDCILLYLIGKNDINNLSQGTQLYIKNREINLEQENDEDWDILLPIKYNSFRILKWFSNNNGFDKQKYFKLACLNGNLDIAKWLYNFGEINIHVDNDYIFRMVCKNNYLDIAKWLYDLDGINIRIDYISMLHCICLEGYLDMAQWFYNLYRINVHDGSEFTFRFTCRKGHLNIAQWLYSLGGINIHILHDDAFQWACINGHLDIAKWLYSLDEVNFYIERFTIEHISKNGHTEIINWLKSINLY